MSNILTKALKHPDRIVSHIVARIKRLQVAEVVRDGELFYEYKGTLYPEYLNHGNACQVIAERALTHCKGRGLDIGAGTWPLPGAIPIQEDSDMNAYDLHAIADSSLDYVFSSHCLEHLDRWQEALSLWISKLKVGGVLFLYLPHESMKMWNPGGPWVGYTHRWQPKCDILLPFLSEHGLRVVDHNPDRDDYWSFHIVCERVSK